MFNVVLFEPEIPANTGNIGRTCVVTGSRLHLIRPLGFELSDHMLRRAGMGYWGNLDVHVYDSWADFLARNRLDEREARREDNGNTSAEPMSQAFPAPRAGLHLLTKKARKTYAEACYKDGDYLVFGKESTGIPEELLAEMPDCCERIPMLPDATTLDNNEAWRAQERHLHQQGPNARPTGDAAGPTGAGANASPLCHQDICGNFIEPDDFRISSLNLSNAVAIVLYEALRQTGFAGM